MRSTINMQQRAGKKYHTNPSRLIRMTMVKIRSEQSRRVERAEKATERKKQI
jgi:hypothetical protein